MARRRTWEIIALGVAFVVAFPYAMSSPPALPSGTHVKSPTLALAPDSVRMLLDWGSYDDRQQCRVAPQEIFDAMLRLIREADRFIYLDVHAWNAWRGGVAERHRDLSAELATELVKRKAARPEIAVLALVDPVNTFYGGAPPDVLVRLTTNGIPVVLADLDQLRDPSTIYAAPVRMYGGLLRRLPFVNAWADRPRFALPFDPGGAAVSAAQVARRRYFRACQRRVLITDSPSAVCRMLLSSLDPADACSGDSNGGLLVEGPLAAKAARAELQCVEWSARNPRCLLASTESWSNAVYRIRAALRQSPRGQAPAAGQPAVELCTEGVIQECVLELLGNAGWGDEVCVALGRLSDRRAVRALQAAAYGGARVRVILDPELSSGSPEVAGIPNVASASELMAESGNAGGRLRVRWADARGGPLRMAAMAVSNPDANKFEFFCASSDFTRPCLDDLNLGAALHITGERGLAEAFARAFDRAWNNQDGLTFTRPYEDLAARGAGLALKRIIYRLQEATGLAGY
jgi:hypothetical protein